MSKKKKVQTRKHRRQRRLVSIRRFVSASLVKLSRSFEKLLPSQTLVASCAIYYWIVYQPAASRLFLSLSGEIAWDTLFQERERSLSTRKSRYYASLKRIDQHFRSLSLGYRWTRTASTIYSAESKNKVTRTSERAEIMVRAASKRERLKE